MKSSCGWLVVASLALSLIVGVDSRAHQASSGSTRHVNGDDSNLLELGQYAPKNATKPVEIKLLSYNIRWRGGEDLNQFIKLLKSDPELGRAAVIGLQEVDRQRKRTGNVNTARLIAQQLSLNYAWAAPPSPATTGETDKPIEEETGVALFSPYPMSDVERIVLPNAGPGGRRRAAIGATIHIGDHYVRAYSVHAETRVSVTKKMEQLEAVLDSLARRPNAERAVVLGDFNTIKGKDVRACVNLFSKRGFITPIPHDRVTWRTFIIELKLDWIWLRGVKPSAHGIVRRIGLSDHWPLWVTVKL